MDKSRLTIKVGDGLMDFSRPRIMGIINVTPDSFYSPSRKNCAVEAAETVGRMLNDGADMIDIGACSTRPGAAEVPEKEEYDRLAPVLDAVRKDYPHAVLSIDTFRSRIAERCVQDWSVAIINDISGGLLDPDMWDTVAGLDVAYVLQHMRGTPATMASFTDYEDVTADVIANLSRNVYELRGKKVCDIIIDPGFGFAKTISQNFRLLDELEEFCKMGCPVMAGLSRKSMIWKTLGIAPEDSLAGTLAVETLAVERGADILRVHDVKEAADIIGITTKLINTRHD